MHAASAFPAAAIAAAAVITTVVRLPAARIVPSGRMAHALHTILHVGAVGLPVYSGIRHRQCEHTAQRRRHQAKDDQDQQEFFLSPVHADQE